MENGFPERLQFLREHKHPVLSRSETADFIGISREMYRKYERGEAAPTLPKLILIAEYFGVTLDYLAFGK